MRLPAEALPYDENVLAQVLEEFLDSSGSMISKWDDWFRKREKLADQFDLLQRRACKLFSLDDIDTALGEDDSPDDRERPSAAEFMARWTVEVCTNMDMRADAKAGKREKTRPSASDYMAENIRYEEDDRNVPAGGRSAFYGDPGVIGMSHEKHASSIPLLNVDPKELRGMMVEGFGLTQDPYELFFHATIGSAHVPRLGNVDYAHDMFGSEMLNFQEQLRHQKKIVNQWKGSNEESIDATDESSCMLSSTEPNLVPNKALWCDIGFKVSDTVREMLKEMADREIGPVRLGEEQMRALALVVDHFEEVLKARRHGQRVPQRVVALMGQGGSGKTEIINIVKRLTKLYVPDGVVMVAPSNSAARNIGGQTIHAAAFLGGKVNYKNENKNQFDKIADSQRHGRDVWKDVEVLVLDEVSMASPQLLGVFSYRVAVLRAGTTSSFDLTNKKHNVPKEFYAKRGECFGGIGLVILAGDFMQLTPLSANGNGSTAESKAPRDAASRLAADSVPRKSVRISLLTDPDDKTVAAGCDWYNGGLKNFHRCVTDVCVLTETYCFRDEVTKEACPVLPHLLVYTTSWT